MGQEFFYMKSNKRGKNYQKNDILKDFKSIIWKH